MHTCTGVGNETAFFPGRVPGRDERNRKLGDPPPQEPPLRTKCDPHPHSNKHGSSRSCTHSQGIAAANDAHAGSDAWARGRNLVSQGGEGACSSVHCYRLRVTAPPPHGSQRSVELGKEGRGREKRAQSRRTRMRGAGGTRITASGPGAPSNKHHINARRRQRP